MIKVITFKSVLNYALPSIFSMLFMSIYVMVDGVFVANLVGIDALSAINITLPVVMFVAAIGTMFGSGGNAVCATLLGQGKSVKANKNFSLFIIVSAILGIIISVATQIWLDEIIVLLGATDRTYTYSYEYLQISAIFSPFAILQIVLQNALIAANKPGLSLISMLVSGFTNIILDYVFIGIFNMGIAGAALATGTGYTLATIIGLLYFGFNKNGKFLYFLKPEFDIPVIIQACANGSSEMVINLATSVTTLLFNFAMLNLKGDDGVAAITIVLYAQLFSNAVFQGYMMGVSPVISFNYGELNSEKLKKLFKTNFTFISISSVIMLLVSILLAEPLSIIFAKKGTAVYDLSTSGLRLFAVGFLFSGFNIFASGMFTAYSNGKISALISFLRTFVLIIIALLVLPNLLGVVGVWLAIPIAEFLTILLSFACIKKYKHKYMYD